MKQGRPVSPRTMEILEEYKKGTPTKIIAHEYGVSMTRVSAIAYRYGCHRYQPNITFTPLRQRHVRIINRKARHIAALIDAASHDTQISKNGGLS